MCNGRRSAAGAGRWSGLHMEMGVQEGVGEWKHVGPSYIGGMVEITWRRHDTTACGARP